MTHGTASTLGHGMWVKSVFLHDYSNGFRINYLIPFKVKAVDFLHQPKFSSKELMFAEINIFILCPTLLSVAIIKHKPNPTWGRKGIIWLKRSNIRRSQSRNSRQEQKQRS